MSTLAAVAIGKYRLVRVLGQGAMGQVYLAEDPYIGRLVAVKVMLTSGEEDEQRFLHEARIIGTLSHPNIVVLHDFGFHEGRPYLVMEYVPGLSLQAWLREPHALSEHLRIMEGFAGALVYAHGRDVLHRDLKPSNLQVMPDGHCKLMDFGIARTQSLLTASGQVMGTPGYMAPEVLEDASYSRQADVYSAGVLLYEMMAGSNPFAGQTVAATLRNVLTLQVPPLPTVRPDVPPPLARAIMSCLARDPRQRPPDLSHLLDVVRASISSTSTVAIEVPRAPVDATRSLLGVPSTRRRRRASRLRAAAAAVVVAGVAASLHYGHGSSSSPPSPGSLPTERATVVASPLPSPPVPSPPVPSPPVAVTPAPRTPPSRVGALPPSARPREPLRAPSPSPVAVVAVEAVLDSPGPTPPASAPPVAGPSVPFDAREPGPARADETRRPHPTAAEATPALLSSITPKTVRRGATFRLELSGSGLQPNHRARVLRGGRAAAGMTVVRQEIVGASLVRIVVLVDEDALLGSYSIALVDGEGRPTNSVGFEVIL